MSRFDASGLGNFSYRVPVLTVTRRVSEGLVVRSLAHASSYQSNATLVFSCPRPPATVVSSNIKTVANPKTASINASQRFLEGR